MVIINEQPGGNLLSGKRYDEASPKVHRTGYDTKANLEIVTQAKKIDLPGLLLLQHKVVERKGNMYLIADGNVDMADDEGYYHRLGSEQIGDMIFYTQMNGSGSWTYGIRGRTARLGDVMRHGEYALLCFWGNLSDEFKTIFDNGKTALLVKAVVEGDTDMLWGQTHRESRSMAFVDPETGVIKIPDARKLPSEIWWAPIIAAK